MTEDTGTPPAADAPRTGSRRSELALALALFAVVLGLVGTAISSWLLMSELRSEPAVSMAQFDEMHASMTARIAQLERSIETVEAAQRPAADLQTRMVSLSTRVDELMQRQAALIGFVNSGAEIHGLARVEALLAIAKDRAQLAGDMGVALAASKRAMRQLESIGGDRLAPVRVTLADEIALLEEATMASDRGSAAAALRAVQASVPRLPFLRREAAPPDGDAAEDADAAWYQKLWHGVSRGLSGVFVIRRNDTELRPLLAPEEAWFLRRNLELTLTGARLALVDGDSQAYVAAINDASNWIRSYFDGEAQRVVQALATLEDIGSVLSSDPAAGIGGALDLLRQIGTVEAP